MEDNRHYGYKNAVEARCHNCAYSKGSAGTWRQQVAACTSVDCENYYLRPVPEGYRVDGEIDQAKCNELADTLARRDSERSRR